jgi:hypothetical protein
MLVDFGDVNQAGDAFHDFTQTPIPLAVVGNQHLDALRQRFMPFGQALETFVDCHNLIQV